MILCGVICAVIGSGMCVLRKRAVWQKVRSPCLVVFVFGLLGILTGISGTEKEAGISSGQLDRNPPGKGEWETEAYVYLPQTDTRYEVILTIPEQKYKSKKEQEVIEAAIAEMRETFCGENASLDQIVVSPDVRERYQQGAVKANWRFSEHKLISPEGRLDEAAVKKTVRFRQKVTASVTFACGESKEEYTFVFYIVPGEKSREEKVQSEIEEQIASQDQLQPTVYLPKQIDGQEARWRAAPSVRSEEILGLGILAATAVLYIQKEQKEKEREKKKRSLILAYPEFVSKLSLLLGAGMSISGALRKMGQMYGQRRSVGGKKEEVYEALHRMICEMDNGMGELRAFQTFSEDCDLQPYRKLVTLLISGQKVGNRRLLEQLNEEADRVFLERKNEARRLGEEAGTKMLVPMMMMLVIVMGIVMIPAFLSIYSI